MVVEVIGCSLHGMNGGWSTVVTSIYGNVPSDDVGQQ